MNDTKCGQIEKDARIFSKEQGSTKPKATKLAFKRRDSKHRRSLARSHGFSPSNPTEHLHYKRRQTKTRKPQTRRADQHRKSRSYCRTERLSYTKPVLGSQWSHKLRVRNAAPAQQGAPDGTLPSCGVRTFPPPCGIRKRPGGASSRKAVADLFGQAMNGKQENRVTKGRECALKYAAGVRTRGERRYAIFERTVNDMPVAYRLAMEVNRRLSIPCFRSPSKGNLVESENAPVGRFPTRLWPTCSAKP